MVFQQCFHSSWRTAASVLSLVNKKGQSTVPSRQNKHTPLLGGQPQAACAPWWPRGLWAFLLLLCHSCRGQPRNASVPGFQKPLFMSLLTTLIQLLGVKMLLSSLRKETSFTQTHFKMCLQEKMSPDIIICIKGYLLYIKPATLGIFNALLTRFGFFKTINSNSINLVTTVCRQEEG